MKNNNVADPHTHALEGYYLLLERNVVGGMLAERQSNGSGSAQIDLFFVFLFIWVVMIVCLSGEKHFVG